MKVFNYGSINIDHVYKVPHLVQPGETLSSSDYQQVLGGKGANQSIALAQAGVNVAHIGFCNESDTWVIDQLQQFGVDCSLVAKVAEPTGHAIIQVDNDAENSIILFAGANHYATVDHLDKILSEAAQDDWLLLQNECSFTREIIVKAEARGLKVIFNPSPMIRDIANFPLDKVSLLVVNEVELRQLLNSGRVLEQDIAVAVAESFPGQNVVVTLGAKGALWIGEGGVVKVPALTVPVVDTTAAGDTFLGFLLGALANGQSPEQALKAGCAASSIAVQRFGASSSIPPAVEVKTLLETL